MRRINRSFVLAMLVLVSNVLAADSSKELPWSSVHLEGMRLQLVSPKAKNQSVGLFFGKGGHLAITNCTEGTCTGPLTIWKIENNRLKTGFAPTEGIALIGVAANKLTLREPSGKIVVYEIVEKSGT